MTTPDTYSARHELLEALLEKVEADPHPSSTMLDMIEELITPDHLPDYAESLMSRIRADRFPSMSLMKRVQNLG